MDLRVVSHESQDPEASLDRVLANLVQERFGTDNDSSSANVRNIVENHVGTSGRLKWFTNTLASQWSRRLVEYAEVFRFLYAVRLNHKRFSAAPA